MKAIALVASARRHGNCYDLARLVLDKMESAGLDTELVNFYDHRITPCQHCDYECLQRLDPEKKADSSCPIDDDVRPIWERTWDSELLFLFVPNYGGLPPALWVAFSQRSQAFFRKAPADRLKRSVVSTVVIAAPQNSSGAQWAPSVMADEVKWMDGRKVAAFEVINNAGYESDGLWGGLSGEPEVRRRMEFLADRTLKIAVALQQEKE
jgi:multimeric flavodoxin WrbA